MPTYEYECTKCARVFEQFQSITASPKRFIKTECQTCNNRAPVVRRIGTGAGIIFKGSGFYQTDYRSEGYKKDAKAEKEARDGKSSKDKKTDTKPTEKKSTGSADSAKSDAS